MWQHLHVLHQAKLLTFQFLKGNLVAAAHMGFNYKRSLRTKTVQVCWKKPEVYGIKLNNDGCSRGNPGVVGVDGIARDCSGSRPCISLVFGSSKQ